MNDAQNPRPENPRRRKRTRAEIIKENYLPTIIIVVTIILCAVFIITAIVQTNNARKAHEAEVAASIAAQEELKKQQDALSVSLLAEAEKYASDYDYQKAIDTIDSFTGDITAYPDLLEKLAEYKNLKSKLVLWNDPAQVVTLSFQILIADSTRAYKDSKYASAYNRNFVTIDEFPRILDQLYANNYMLVSLDDIYECQTDSSGITTYTPRDLYLPAGKKPLMITQTQVNYYFYMTDGNGDKIPDAKGAGFASKLIVDENGKFTNTYVDASGKELVGAYDMVPLLENFVALHPDFSYRGAKAILAVTGSDGIFGYRTYNGAANTFGQAAYDADVEGAAKLVAALRDAGYEIACYTYDNLAYGSNSLNTIKSDLSKWKNEVEPILGDVRTFVFAQNSDIGSRKGPYSGQTYNELKANGFEIFFGFADGDGNTWSYEGGQYVRLGRIMVSGSNIKHNSTWFEGIFDPVKVLDANRGSIPY